MPRSRSRSHERHRRSTSRDREHRRRRSRSRSPRRQREREKRRSRSRSPRRDRIDSRREFRDRDVPRAVNTAPDVAPVEEKPADAEQQAKITEAQLLGKTQEEIDMIKLLGIGGFESTKGKHVDGNDWGTANVAKKRRYRQYMNRKGGFNRPLDPVL